MKPFILAILVLSSIFGYSQTIHFAFFGAINDERLHIPSEAALRYFKYTFAPSLQNVGFKVNARFYVEDDFTRINLDNWLSSLHTGSNDVIIFYFTGHGCNDCEGRWSVPNDYPSIWVGLKKTEILQNIKSEKEIFDALKSKPHKLLLTIAESCNRCATGMPSTNTTDMVSYELFDMDITKIKRLFEESGDYLVSSCRKGEYSWGTGIGFFTRAFMDVFEEETSKISTGSPTWNVVFSTVSSRTTQIAYDHKDSKGNRYIQHPQFKAYNTTTPHLTLYRSAKPTLDKILRGRTYAGKRDANGLKTGIGIAKYSDGSYYIGSYSNDKCDGNGVLISANGEIKCGKWSNSVFSSGTKYNGSSSGSQYRTFKLIRTVLGNYYFGEVDRDGYYFGLGLFIESNGSAWFGSWYDGTQYDGNYI